MSARSGRSGWGWLIGVGIVVVVIAGLIGGDDDEGSTGHRMADHGNPQRQHHDHHEDQHSNFHAGNPGGSGQQGGAGAPSGIPDAAKQTTVRSVTDGDTIVLAGLGSSRLIGVDTPEVYGGEECYGPQASAFTESKLPPGTHVYFVHGPEDTDQYGRDLVYVWLSGGTFFNALLAKQGYATQLTIPPNVDYAGLFHHLVASARAADRGLWAPGACQGSSGSGGGGTAGAPGTAGDKDCADFSSQDEAQQYFEDKGGPDSDPDLLDADHDGVACETLP